MSRKCAVCNKIENKSIFNIFSWFKKCGWCGILCCKDCRKSISEFSRSEEKSLLREIDRKYDESRLCTKCYSQYRRDFDKMTSAIKSHAPIELVSKNYKGSKPVVGNKHTIKTGYYEDREDAKKELITLARYFNCDIVLNVHYCKEVMEEDTQSGGVHRYSTWAYQGVAAKKR